MKITTQVTFHGVTGRLDTTEFASLLGEHLGNNFPYEELGLRLTRWVDTPAVLSVEDDDKNDEGYYDDEEIEDIIREVEYIKRNKLISDEKLKRIQEEEAEKEEP